MIQKNNKISNDVLDTKIEGLAKEFETFFNYIKAFEGKTDKWRDVNDGKLDLILTNITVLNGKVLCLEKDMEELKENYQDIVKNINQVQIKQQTSSNDHNYLKEDIEEIKIKVEAHETDITNIKTTYKISKTWINILLSLFVGAIPTFINIIINYIRPK